MPVCRLPRLETNANPMNLLEADPPIDRASRARRHDRIRRAKQFLRPLPRKATLHRWPILNRFAKTARKRPYLWSFREREVSVALYLGFVIAFLPLVGIQFLLALAAAWTLRANLPVIIGAQLTTNVLTMGPIYFVLNRFGSELIGLFGLTPVEATWSHSVYASVLGGLVAGVGIAFILDLVYRFVFAQAKKRPINLKRMGKK